MSHDSDFIHTTVILYRTVFLFVCCLFFTDLNQMKCTIQYAVSKIVGMNPIIYLGRIKLNVYNLLTR